MLFMSSGMSRLNVLLLILLLFALLVPFVRADCIPGIPCYYWGDGTCNCGETVKFVSILES